MLRSELPPYKVIGMTTTETVSPFPAHTQVEHRLHGVGVVIRVHSRTHVDVQWPGMTMTRREHVDGIERYVPPAPVTKRRTRHA